MLDISLKDQLKNIFAVLEAQYTLDIAVAPQHESRQELTEMLADVAECTDKISCRIREGKELEFSLLKNGSPLSCLPSCMQTGKGRIFRTRPFVTG